MRRIIYQFLIISILVICGWAILGAVQDQSRMPQSFKQESPLEVLQNMPPFKNGVSSLTIFFRPLDTLGSILVLSGGVIAMRSLISQEDTKTKRGEIYESAVLSLITGAFFSLCFVFALYLLLYGNQHPGGGINGGIMAAAGSILFFLAFGHRVFAQKFHPEYFISLSAAGMLFFVTAFLCITFFPGSINMVSGLILGLGLLISVGVILTGLFWELAKAEKGEE
ncbi:MAG: MnhB domain-containing protein [Candidatus Schekmanbacteria bacterium]|nr:MnhB domain-containing protein [Candidatus Schekmanbacteria bacterium]